MGEGLEKSRWHRREGRFAAGKKTGMGESEEYWLGALALREGRPRG